MLVDPENPREVEDIARPRHRRRACVCPACWPRPPALPRCVICDEPLLRVEPDQTTHPTCTPDERHPT